MKTICHLNELQMYTNMVFIASTMFLIYMYINLNDLLTKFFNLF